MRGRFRYRFVIEEVYTPETLPMSRLAEYMAKVAALLGERPQVHFVGMEGVVPSWSRKSSRKRTPRCASASTPCTATTGRRMRRWHTTH